MAKESSEKLRILFPFLAFFYFPLPSFAQRLPETILRIGIVRNASSASIGAGGRFVAVDLSNGRKEVFSLNKSYLARPRRSGGVVLGDQDLGPQVRLMASGTDARLMVNGRRYRDSLLVQSGGDGLTVINELSRGHI